jgi:hypothetical protein
LTFNLQQLAFYEQNGGTGKYVMPAKPPTKYQAWCPTARSPFFMQIEKETSPSASLQRIKKDESKKNRSYCLHKRTFCYLETMAGTACFFVFLLKQNAKLLLPGILFHLLP